MPNFYLKKRVRYKEIIGVYFISLDYLASKMSFNEPNQLRAKESVSSIPPNHEEST